MVDAWLNQIAQMIGENTWLAPLLALVAGILTSVTPCSLSSVPLIIGYVGSTGEKTTKKAFFYSIIFAAGTAVTFVILGIIATSAGRLLGTSSSVWYFILGVLMVLMALQTWEIFQCSTPVLIALLAIVAGEGNLFWGILLMLLYSVGHSALVVVAGTSIGFVQKINASEQYKKAAFIIKLIMGIFILFIGFYMFWLTF